MRVLICAMAYPPDILGGGEISTRLLAEGLTQSGIDVSVLTFTDGPPVREEINRVLVDRIECRNIYWSFRSRTKSPSQKTIWHLSEAFRQRIHSNIRDVVTRISPTIVHTSTIEDFGSGFWRWAKQAGYITVHTLRSNCLLHRSANLYDAKRDRALTPDFLARPKRHASKSVDAVVGISNDILQRHLHYCFFPNAVSCVIGNPFEGQAADTRVRSNGDIKLGVLGRIEPDKGIEPLIDQLRACRSNQPWSLRIAGTGQREYVRHLQDKSEGLPIEFVDWTESRPFLRNLDLLVIPSRCLEAFGRGVVEAYSVGVPVLCLRRGGLPELIREGETGWVLDDFSPSSLSHAIDNCRSLNSKRIVREAQDYHVGRIAEKYCDLYESLAGTGKNLVARKAI